MGELIPAIWQKYGYVYIQGAWGTVYIALLTVFFGTILGTLLSFLRLSRVRPLQWIVQVYIWILRGTPTLLQIYFFYFYLPRYLPFEMSERACIITALVVNASAYVEEVIRAGIQAVDRGQTEAARSLGMTARHTMTRIVLPQAFKTVQSATFITIPALIISGAIYLALTTVLSALMKLVEKRLQSND